MAFVIMGDITYEHVEACFAPKGEGYTVQDVVGCHWIESVEDAFYASYREDEPRLDYPNLDLWGIHRDRPSGTMELEGEELRRLFQEVYEIYAQKGLFDPPKPLKKRGWFGW